MFVSLFDPFYFKTLLLLLLLHSLLIKKGSIVGGGARSHQPEKSMGVLFFSSSSICCCFCLPLYKTIRFPFIWNKTYIAEKSIKARCNLWEHNNKKRVHWIRLVISFIQLLLCLCYAAVIILFFVFFFSCFWLSVLSGCLLNVYLLVSVVRLHLPWNIV